MPATSTSISSPWTCPPQGIVKIYTDAHVIEHCKSGLGVVIRIECGVIMDIATRRVYVTMPKIAEALSVRFGLQMERGLGMIVCGSRVML